MTKYDDIYENNIKININNIYKKNDIIIDKNIYNIYLTKKYLNINNFNDLFIKKDPKSLSNNDRNNDTKDVGTQANSQTLRGRIYNPSAMWSPQSFRGRIYEWDRGCRFTSSSRKYTTINGTLYIVSKLKCIYYI